MKHVRIIALLLFLTPAGVCLGAETAPQFTDDTLLLFQPMLDEVAYEEISLPVHQWQGHYYLPLQALANFSGLGLKASPMKGRAEGWLTRESDIFRLDVAKHQVFIHGEIMPFPPHRVVANNEDIFVEQSLLEHWLPLRFTFNPHKLVLTIHPTSPLPIQQQAARRQQWERLKQRHSKAAQPVSFPLPYQQLSWPFMDITLGQNYRHSNTDRQEGGSYFMQAGGDMGLLSTQIAAGGSSDAPLDTLRITAGRQDSDATLLGPLHATEFALGDVHSAYIPLVAGAGDGRGIALSNQQLNRTQGLDSTRFSGDAMPGWDVELYRNGILLDAQHIGDEGRYVFDNVQVLFGSNRFTLVFYGPEGQRREETREVMTSSSILKQGAFTYALSVNEKYSSTLPISREDRPFTFVSTIINGEEIEEEVPAQQGVRSILYTEYGLTDTLTLAFGSAHIPLATEVHDYITEGIRAALFDRLLLSQDIGHDLTSGGMVEKTSMLTALYGASLKAEHSIYSSFVGETEEKEATTLKRVSAGELTLPLPSIPMVNAGFALKRQQFAVGESEITLNQRLSTSLHGVSITHALTRQETHSPGVRDIDTSGQMAVSGTVKGTTLRAAASYALSDRQMTAAGISAQKQWKKNLVITMGITDDRQSGDTIATFATLSWECGAARYSVKLDANSEEELYLGTNISFSLAKPPSSGWHLTSEPAASSGAAAMRAFLDSNNDGIFTTGEQWIPEASFRAGTKRVTSHEGEAAFALGLPASVPATVTLDESSLEDPLWISPHPGYQFIPRPGVVAALTFPVIASSEIEGSVYRLTAEGKKPYPSIIVELVDANKQVVKQVKSEFDGVYMFERVPPGHYQLRLQPALLKETGTRANDYRLDIGGAGDVYDNNDFTVVSQHAPPL